MRIGVCCGPGDWQKAADAGYDYVEPVFSSVAAMSGEEFLAAKQKLRDSGLRAETYNGFFGSGVSLFACDGAWLKEYLGTAFGRAAELGGRIAVLGSGKARRVPEGMPAEEARDRFASVVRTCADAAQGCGMRLVIEPLRYEETNLINTVAQSAAFIREVGHPALGTLVDFFHFWCNGEKPDELDGAADLLWHTHLARPDGDRRAPTEADREALRPYAAKLREIGYAGTLSLECSWASDLEGSLCRSRSVLEMFRAV